MVVGHERVRDVELVLIVQIVISRGGSTGAEFAFYLSVATHEHEFMNLLHVQIAFRPMSGSESVYRHGISYLVCAIGV